MFKKKVKQSSLITQLQKPSEQTACIFIDEAQQEKARLSYTELDKKARAVAVYLQTMIQSGDRVLLMYPTGVDFVVAFVGCLYAGVVAVPVSRQLLQENDESLVAIARDANIAGILTTEIDFQKVQAVCQPVLSTRKSFVLDTLHLHFDMDEKYRCPVIEDETIAYLHYTPSSALTPKGVVVRHKNLNHSLKFTAQVWRYSKKSMTCNGLPHTDAQGLVLGVLVPLYTRTPVVLVSPEAIRKNPLLWLQTISKYQVTHSGTLNTGFDNCIREIESPAIKNLKLKTWKVAFSTGENLSFEVVNAFHKKFAPAGFHPNHFSSAYVLAETVGIASVTTPHKMPTIFNLNIEAMKRNEVILTHKNIPHRKFIGNGHLLPGLDAVIVDVEKNLPLTEGKIGEICLSGESVVDEYWNMPDSAEFYKVIPGVKGKFFRTGDIGFIKNGEICLVGRLDELLHLGGKKYYPQDLEATVAIALRSLPVSEHSAVFSIMVEGSPVGVFVQEVKNPTEAMLEEIIRNIRRAVTQRHGVDLYEVVLVKENTLPVSENGKLRYDICCQRFLSQTLSVVASYRHRLSTKKTETVLTKSNKVPKLKPQDLSGIAVIGMSGIFPGANNIDQLWENLLQGHNPLQSVPADRWSWKQYFGDVQMDNYPADIKWGGFIQGISQFDADFFDISAREAELMDPQQRLLLEVAYTAVEDAGYTQQAFVNTKTGVFVGASNHDYAELMRGVTDAYAKTGLSHAMLANRISQYFKLTGPSEVVDTGESSGLVALHHAVRALKTGECDVAIVGGVNALLSPTTYLNQSKAKLLSATGVPRVFDNEADGYVRGEGACALVLKPLAKAYEAGDHIYGVIKNAVSAYGASLEEQLLNATQQADIPLESISFIEANATGSYEHDATEVNSLQRLFENNQQAYHCGLGSIKANIGHLEGASGLASLIKVMLSLKQKQLPGNLHFNQLNSTVTLENSGLYVVDTARPWLHLVNEENEEIPRRATVNAFGASGVNALALVEEYLQEKEIVEPENQAVLITLSARTEIELCQRIADLHDWLLKQNEMVSLASISYTLNRGRQHFDKRCALVVSSMSELQSTLSVLLDQEEPENVVLNLQGNKKTKWRPIFQTLFEQLMQDLAAGQMLSPAEYRNKLLAVGNFYTEGYEIHWQELYVNQPTRASLPTYPFTKNHYWVPDQAEILEFNGALQNSIA